MEIYHGKSLLEKGKLAGYAWSKSAIIHVPLVAPQNDGQEEE